MNIGSLERKYIISPKISYFVLSFQFYILHQFRSLFAREEFKIEESQIGMIMGVIYFLTFFTNLGIAAINDRFNRPKLLLMSLIAFSIIPFQLLRFNIY